MNQDIIKRLKQIKIENNIWIIYIGIIILSLYGNSKEKDYFLTNNIQSKEIYRKINTIIFIILIMVYTYFEKDAIESFHNKKKSTTQQKYDTLILIASTAILVSGFIFLYIILEDENLEEEIAFN